jgi:uncharacterized protein (TIGR03435 family)
MIPELTNHLWQSTWFAAAVWLLTLAFRRTRASVRYGLWLSASLKFFVPFALLIGLGGHVPLPRASEAVAASSFTIVDTVRPSFAPAAAVSPARHSSMHAILTSIWLCGVAALLLIRLRHWLRIRAAIRSSLPAEVPTAIEARSAPGLLEPGIAGWLRPILLLPAGIEDRLTPDQFDAVLIHELCHARRRDNLTSAMHMIVETLFWFHPLVWWIGARLVEERERACDEAVLREGHDPADYAEAILSVCRLYVESPLVCIAGVTGSDLKQRMKWIMLNQPGTAPSALQKLVLTAAAFSALLLPIAIGSLSAFRLDAQPQLLTSGDRPSFDVASVKPNNSGADGVMLAFRPQNLIAKNMTLLGLVQNAYATGLPLVLEDFRILGLPNWAKSDRFDVMAKTSENLPFPYDRMKLMLQSLLAERFGLQLHSETHELPVFELRLARSDRKLGSQIHSGDADCLGVQCNPPFGPPGVLTARQITMQRLAENLSWRVHRTVLNRTGLDGVFAVDMHWTPDTLELSNGGPLGSAPPLASPPPQTSDDGAIFSALQEQLGLKLESTKGPVEVLVIDHVEKPAPN